jgi:uncharacterized protein HemX
MDEMNTNNTPVGTTPSAGTAPESNVPQEKSAGGLAGIIIVIVLLVAGALYVWQTKSQPEMPVDTVDTVTSSLQTQGTSTEPDAIESDLMNTNIDSIDADMGALLIDSDPQ